MLYVLAYVVCCVLLVPALALTLGAGAIFGFAGGAIVVLIGATLGATAAFLLGADGPAPSRRADDRRQRQVPRARPRHHARRRQDLWLVRVSGFPPFTWVNYAFGLTGVHLAPFLVTTFFGIIPGTLAFTYAGAAGAAALTGSGNRVLLIVTAVGAVARQRLHRPHRHAGHPQAGVEDASAEPES